ncbi:SusF/SusE family outer membrane protein [Labilibaculum sp. K2S]|uniref:SusF/SusE family outer membrane protein n=1 Tax=Labilibaculum sp. K2S TaxID=3056386 RepID=UPI0025A35AF0|nr:SusF/SusE family outer membrane protein [Labilibaculum sp. K2S]MDM8160673.1 SusF/SusE family outer membrane protein [Labilibaculum sp. K2S]
MKNNIFIKLLGLAFTALLLVFVGCDKDDLVKLDAEMATWQKDGITSTSVELSGIVVAEGDGISEYGIVWGTTENPTTADSKKVADNVEKAVYWVTVDGLEHLTTYHYRAYVITNGGTTLYGKDDVFTTLAHKPTIIISNEATDITDITANIAGEVPYDGKALVTTKGICWSTEENPTIAGLLTDEGEGMGEFTSALTNLRAKTVYYARAYATNSIATVYSAQITFTTLVGIATVETGTASAKATTAQVAGNVIYNGGLTISERGVCYGKTENPTIADSKVTNTGENGEFTVDISGLETSTTYHARAYAINSEGVAYGAEVLFSTFPTTMYINGSFVPSWDWNNAAVLEMIPVHSNPHLFWKIAWFNADSELKFNSELAWNGAEFGKTGDTAGADGVWNKGGDNIPTGAEGYKMVVVNLLANTIQITDPVIYAQGSAFGNWNGGEFLFTPDVADAKILVSPAAVADDNARMYVTATTLTNTDNNPVDWWQAELSVLVGKIEYRGAGNDLAGAPITTGQKVKLNFSTESGIFE